MQYVYIGYWSAALSQHRYLLKKDRSVASQN